MKNIILGFALFLALTSLGQKSYANEIKNSNETSALFGNHVDEHGDSVDGHYCPIGYRLVYGPHYVYQMLWNGYAWVYYPVLRYGYYCIWP